MSKEEEAISNLKRYIEEDLIYKENKPESDFDEFCINHCRDIETVLNYIKELEFKYQARKDRYEKSLENKSKEFKEALEYEFQERERDYISKQVIRDKIEELEKYIYTGANAPQDFLQYRIKAKIQVLKELLEEE